MTKPSNRRKQYKDGRKLFPNNNTPRALKSTSDAETKRTGIEPPESAKNHIPLRTGTRDLMTAEEYAPFDSRTSKTRPVDIRRRVVTGRVVRARLQGMSQKQIAENFGLSTAAVRTIIKNAMQDEYPQEDKETLRTVINAQYDKMIESWWSAAVLEGDDKAAKILQSLLADKRKLNAVDEQVITKVESNEQVKIDVTAAAAEILERFGAQANDPEAIEATVVEDDDDAPQLNYNPAVLEMLEKNRNVNTLTDEDMDTDVFDVDSDEDADDDD